MKAFRILEGAPGQVVDMDPAELSAGEVSVQVSWSSVNYKDALAGLARGKILRRYPLNGGIDVAGTVSASRDPRYREGDEVLVTGCGLSETRDGGYAEHIQLPAEWVIPLPSGLSAREAMGLGTAGFTAALSLKRMLDNGQRPDMGPVVVTGATGGVGMLALDLLTTAGFEVHAISGKPDRFDDLIALGARQCISRENLYWGQRPLEAATWAGAIDNVGGDMLAGLTRMIHPYGNIASCGLTQSAELHTTVMPFIIRGVSILGIASAGTDYATRQMLWEHLAADWKPRHLDRVITREVTLEGLPDVFHTLLAGGAFGRTVVRVGG